MPSRWLLYYITGRRSFAGDAMSQRRCLLKKIEEAARAEVDYIQLRERDLPSRELEVLACEAMQIISHARTENPRIRTALLVNSRTDVALAAGTDGVHLRSDDVSPQAVREIWNQYDAGVLSGEGRLSPPVIGVSLHSVSDVERAEASGATFAVFGPVFEKKDAPTAQPTGLVALRNACRTTIPVLALGGVTLENAASCLEAGAAGIAGVRLFQDNEIAAVVKQLRG